MKLQSENDGNEDFIIYITKRKKMILMKMKYRKSKRFYKILKF